MTITAARCVLVSSPWVHAFILTCDDKLAVWFKRRVRGGRAPGVCCYYPATNRNFFNLAITWGSPGKFVHRFLYKKLGYRIIAPPCPPAAGGCPVQTSCCTNTLPGALHASGNLGVGTVTLTYDGSQYWAGQCSPNCGDAVKLRFWCNGGSADCSSLELDYSCDNGAHWIPMGQQAVPPCSCSPLSISYSTTLSTVNFCSGCNGQNLNMTVTT
jgi:hypothetical protein